LTYNHVFTQLPRSMLDISSRILTLRKQQKLSQSALAKAIGASRDIIGKYERGEHSPSIEMAVKLADALGVSVDYLLGKERFASYDKETVKRLQDLHELDPDTRTTLFSIIDTFVRDARARTNYATT
jgi:transcriptional regulator with XRE-family HTH domain